MLAFIFGSTMFLVMLGSLAMMAAFGRSRRFKKITGWVVFVFALMAGSAAALSFVGQFITWVLTFAFTIVGMPLAAIGIMAAFGVVGMVIDLLDGQPDGFAKTMGLVVPVLLATTGGALGMYGGEATGAMSDAGVTLFGNLVGV